MAYIQKSKFKTDILGLRVLSETDFALITNPEEGMVVAVHDTVNTTASTTRTTAYQVKVYSRGTWNDFAIIVNGILTITAPQSVAAGIILASDEGDDDGDSWKIFGNDANEDAGTSGKLTFSNDVGSSSPGTFVEMVSFTADAVPTESTAAFAGNVVVKGDLTVDGDTTTINSTTLSVDDKMIELGTGEAVSGLSGSLVNGQSTVTLTGSHRTTNMMPGQVLTKTAGSGGLIAGSKIVTVDSELQITVDNAHNATGGIQFNVGAATDVTADGGGITLKGTTDKRVYWSNTSKNWTFDQGVMIHQTAGIKKPHVGYGSYLNYPLYVHAPTATNETTGIGFGTAASVGAAIIFKDKGTNSPGELSFFTKSSATAGVAPVQRMVLDKDGNVGIGVADPDSTLEILDTTTQQKWSYDADSFATMTVADASHTTVATGESGNLTIDVAGNIELNADGGTVEFKDDAELLMTLTDAGLTFDDATVIETTAGNLDIKATGTDADIIFTVDDGGTDFVALTIDGSNNGNAFFTPRDSGYLDVNDADTDGYTRVFGNGTLKLSKTADNANMAGSITFYRERTGSSGTPAGSVENNDKLGELIFHGDDLGTPNAFAASIQVFADGDHGDTDDSDSPGRIEFHTTPNDSSAMVERMVIKSDGKVGIGTPSPATLVHVNKASGENELRLQSSDKYTSIIQKDNAELIVQNASAGPIIFYDNSAETMRIEAGGEVGIGVSDPDARLEILSTSTQLKLSNNADDYATFAVGTHGDLTITTHDQAAGAANFVVIADGAVDIDANAGSLSLDGSGGINIGTETDVAVDIDASILQINSTDTTHLSMNANAASTKTMVISAANTNGSNVSNLDIDADGTLSLDGGTSITIGTAADKPIDIDASTLSINASDNTNITVGGAGKTLDIDASGALTIDSGTSIAIGTAADKPVSIDSTTFEIDASGGVRIDGTTLSLDGVDDTNLTMTANAAGNKVLVIDAANTGSGNASISIGTTASTAVNIGNATSEVTIGDNLTVTGDFTVNGTTTTVNSTTITVDDKNIELGSVSAPSNTTADGGGITLKGATDKELKWVNATGRWTTNVGLHINTTDALVVPVGNTATRPGSAANGMIRYNTTDNQYEGYGNSVWSSLGGVRDVDGDTYIQAETSAGVDNDDLEFYTFAKKRMSIEKEGYVRISDSSGNHELNVFGTISAEKLGSEIVPTPTNFSDWTDQTGNASFTNSAAWANNGSNELVYAFNNGDQSSDQKAKITIGNAIEASTLYELSYTVAAASGSSVLKLDHSAPQMFHGGSGITLASTNGTHVQQITSHSNSVNTDKIQIFVQVSGATSGDTFKLTNFSLKKVKDGKIVAAGNVVAAGVQIGSTTITSLDEDMAGGVSASHDSLATAKTTKSYIDTQLAGIDLTFDTAGDTGTGSVSTAQALTVTGGTGITTSAASQAVTVALSSIAAGRVLGNIHPSNPAIPSAVEIDTDLTSGVSANDDTLASAKAIKTYADTKQVANSKLTQLSGLAQNPNTIPYFSSPSAMGVLALQTGTLSNNAATVPNEASVKAAIDAITGLKLNLVLSGSDIANPYTVADGAQYDDVLVVNTRNASTHGVSMDHPENYANNARVEIINAAVTTLTIKKVGSPSAAFNFNCLQFFASAQASITLASNQKAILVKTSSGGSTNNFWDVIVSSI